MTIEEAKKAGFRIDAEGWATTWRILKTEKIRRLYSKVRGLDAKDFPTRAKAREALRKRKLDAEHAKWLADMQAQTTPITPEQAKLLRPDDPKYGCDMATLAVFGILGDAKEDPVYAKPPLFFTEQAARNRLNEVIAAQAARDKAKCSTLPEGVAPVPEGYEFVDPNKIEIVMADSKTYIFDVEEKRWLLLNGFNSGLMVSTKWNLEHGIYFARPKTEAEPQPKVGDFCDELDIIRALYRNPLWLAKHGKDVESHETPVGETQAKEVVTDETQPTILEEAAKCVTGPRRRDYGTPDENFGLIASLWSVQLKHEVTPMQVALCLILLKVARQSNSPKRDNLVDIAGYAQCASELKGAK